MLVHYHRFSKNVNPTSEFYEQECVVEVNSIRSDHMLGMTEKNLVARKLYNPALGHKIFLPNSLFI